jgi:hypothetical protein
MNSPGVDLTRHLRAKTFPGWGRFVARFCRGYGLGLAAAGLALLAADALWPESGLFAAVSTLLAPAAP